jgi:hypothetical protein
MPDVQDDDISLADFPRIHAETQTRRASAVDIEDDVPVKSVKRSVDAQSCVKDLEETYPGKDAKANENSRTSGDQDSYHARTGFALSAETFDIPARKEDERWKGKENEKRDESRLTRIWRVSMRHLRFVGPGLVSSVRPVASIPEIRAVADLQGDYYAGCVL